MEKRSRDEYWRNDNNISYPFIDHIVKAYAPAIKRDRNIKYTNMELFRHAMTHRSCIEAGITNYSYERLEYLGDAIFHLIITTYLYNRYDEECEGFLTKLRIRLERGKTMADLSRNLSLDVFVQLSGINCNDHVLEDIFEAFIGAFYLNYGKKYTEMLIISIIEKHICLPHIIYRDDNFKDVLLRYFHQMGWEYPKYHVKKNMTDEGSVELTGYVKKHDNTIMGKAVGTSKKDAEQMASKDALTRLGVVIDGIVDQGWINGIDAKEKQIKIKKKDKKNISIYNPSNIKTNKADVVNLLKKYSIVIPAGTVVSNYRLFQEAMTHRSYLKNTKLTDFDKEFAKNCVKLQSKANDRLQFLGDTVYHFVIGEHLYQKYPDKDEGFLTRLRAKLENREALFNLSKKTGVSDHVLINSFIELNHKRDNHNIMARAFDAFIGAIYLELGFDLAKKYIMNVVDTEIDITEISAKDTNYKELILRLFNQNRWGQPKYKILDRTGPDHEIVFTMGLYRGNKLLSSGTAKSKKKAEQLASMQLYASHCQ